METLARMNETVSRVVWGPAMLVLMVGTGIFLTLRCGFFQFTHFGRMLRHTLGGIFAPRKRGSGRGISPFAAVSTALAGTMGTGNITGVAAAMLLGGPGSVFWMWISALFGMMTKYAEVVLAVRYRQDGPDGRHGGPMYYLSRGLRAPLLAALFCALCTAASFGIGNMAQANAVAGALHQSFGVPEFLTGIAAMLLVGLIVVGGLRRIASVAEITVPLMSALYLAFALAVLFRYRHNLPGAFADILTGAFTPLGVLGGCGGWGIARAMRSGIARGVFSNEAGLGSAPIAHAAADTDSPVEQGLWGMFEVFADTLVCCTLTALVLLVTGVLDTPLPAGGMTSAAFSLALGPAGGAAVSVSLAFFALSSILGWCYYGESCLAWLTHGSKTAAALYRWLFLLMIPVGAVTRLETVWSVSDTLNGLMALPNLIGVLGLSGTVAAATREYCKARAPQPQNAHSHRALREETNRAKLK